VLSTTHKCFCIDNNRIGLFYKSATFRSQVIYNYCFSGWMPSLNLFRVVGSTLTNMNFCPCPLCVLCSPRILFCPSHLHSQHSSQRRTPLHLFPNCLSWSCSSLYCISTTSSKCIPVQSTVHTRTHSRTHLTCRSC